MLLFYNMTEKTEKSAIWKFFNISKDDQSKAQCKICNDIISRCGQEKIENNINMKTHLTLHHNDEFTAELEKVNQEKLNETQKRKPLCHYFGSVSKKIKANISEIQDEQQDVQQNLPSAPALSGHCKPMKTASPVYQGRSTAGLSNDPLMDTMYSIVQDLMNNNYYPPEDESDMDSIEDIVQGVMNYIYNPAEVESDNTELQLAGNRSYYLPLAGTLNTEDDSEIINIYDDGSSCGVCVTISPTSQSHCE